MIEACPFCKSTTRIITYDNVDYEAHITYEVGCTSTSCYLYEGAGWHFDSVDEATRKWNEAMEKL